MKGLERKKGKRKRKKVLKITRDVNAAKAAV